MVTAAGASRNLLQVSPLKTFSRKSLTVGRQPATRALNSSSICSMGIGEDRMKPLMGYFSGSRRNSSENWYCCFPLNSDTVPMAPMGALRKAPGISGEPGSTGDLSPDLASHHFPSDQTFASMVPSESTRATSQKGLLFLSNLCLTCWSTPRILNRSPGARPLSWDVVEFIMSDKEIPPFQFFTYAAAGATTLLSAHLRDRKYLEGVRPRIWKAFGHGPASAP